MPARKYTDEQIDLVIQLREKGWSYARISQRTGMSQGSIYWYCLRDGAEPPNSAGPVRPVAEMPMTYKRGGHTIRRYTAAEDATILRLRASGMSLKKIGERLGRPHNSIMGRLMTLARHQARAEADAGIAA